MIEPYKNRVIDESKPVYVYRCLNRKGYVFSVKQNNLVVAHTDSMVIKNCEFLVNKAGKKRAIKTGVRNVHAFIKGFIGDFRDIRAEFSGYLCYHPFKVDAFMIWVGNGHLGRPITKSEVCWIDKKNKCINVQEYDKN